MISARVIEDSIYDGVRLTTLQLRYPRFIHSEFMTHRVFSRNASSSRAIPAKTVRQRVLEDMAIPTKWGMNKPGMQAETLAGAVRTALAKKVWQLAAYAACGTHWLFEKLGIHKQITNRILEPFSHIDVIVTATEWDNFFKLRLDKAAQPEIQALAKAMLEAMEMSVPEERAIHLPYVQQWERNELSTEKCYLISAARCARVSYLNHDKTKPSVEKDLALAGKLLQAEHMSPFEHQAAAIPDGSNNGWSANFRQWSQYRQML